VLDEVDFLQPNTHDDLMLFGADMCNFGFYDWPREFWWILAWHNDQQEIILSRLRMPITWRCKPPSKEHPSYGLLLQFIITCGNVSFDNLVSPIFH
jgi:hypothetical protein